MDYRIRVRGAGPLCVVAPHGGSIEPGTSELAIAIAAEQHSLYVFEGLKSTNNRALHITSARFDEPQCLALVTRCDVVLTLHGEASDGSVQSVYLGGLDRALGERIRTALVGRQFDVRAHPDARLSGLEPLNLCNRGRSGAGVQLELSRGLRRTLFAGLGERGRSLPAQRFGAFVEAVRAALPVA